MDLKCSVRVVLLLIVAVSVSGHEKKQEAKVSASSAAAADNHHPVFLPGAGHGHHGDNLGSGHGSGHVIQLPGVLNLPLQNPFNLPDRHHGINSASSQFHESGHGFNSLGSGQSFNDASFSQFDQSAQFQGGQNFQGFNHQASDFNQQDVQFAQQTPQFHQSEAQFQHQAPEFNLPAAQFHQQDGQFQHQGGQFLQHGGAQFHQQSAQFEGFGASFNQQAPQFQNFGTASAAPAQISQAPTPTQNHRVEIVIKHEPQQQQVVYRTDQVHQRQPVQIATSQLTPQTLTQVVKQVEKLTPAVLKPFITSNTVPQLTTVAAKKEQLPQLDHRFDVISTVKQPQPVQVQRVVSVPQPIQQVRVVQQQQVQKPVQVQRIVSVPQQVQQKVQQQVRIVQVPQQVQQKVQQQVRIVQVPAPVVQKPVVQQIQQQVHQVQRVQHVQPIQQVQRVQQVQQVQHVQREQPVQQVQQQFQQGYHVHAQALTQAEYERLEKLQVQDPASIRSYHLRDLLEGRGSYSSQYEGLVKNVQQQQPIQLQRVQTQSPALAQRFDSSSVQKQNVRVVSAPAPTPAPVVVQRAQLVQQTPVQNVQIVRQQQSQPQPIQFQQVQQVQQSPVQSVSFVQQQQQTTPLQVVQLRNVQQTLPIVSFSDNVNLAPLQSQYLVSTPAPAVVTLPYQNFGIVSTPAPVLSHIQTFTTAPVAQPLLLQRLDHFPAEQLSQQTSQNEIRTAFRSKPASKVDSDEYVDVEETFSVEANANIVEKNGVARRAENINEILQKIKH